MIPLERLPVLGICGYSGAGKTALICALIPRLTARGLRVAVIKHDAHGLNVDQPGKDSQKLFEAGADVFLGGPDESFARRHGGDAGNACHALAGAASRHDVVLVEGYKDLAFPNKLWLRRTAGDRPPPETTGLKLDLRPAEDRLEATLRLLDTLLFRSSRRTPVYAGVLIGGRSSRMGSPKHLLRVGNRTWLEHIVKTVQPPVERVVLLGRGNIPGRLKGFDVLPDTEGVGGPLAGMLSAMRWAPWVSWLFVACDLPLVSHEAVTWLLGTRAPGVWATLPKPAGGIEPLLAHYDFRARDLLESSRGPCAIASSPNVITPSPPPSLSDAWTNVNTKQDRRKLNVGETRQTNDGPSG